MAHCPRYDNKVKRVGTPACAASTAAITSGAAFFICAVTRVVEAKSTSSPADWELAVVADAREVGGDESPPTAIAELNATDNEIAATTEFKFTISHPPTVLQSDPTALES